MKALTVPQPHASALVLCARDVVNERRHTRHRGWLLIHAAAVDVTREMPQWQTSMYDAVGGQVLANVRDALLGAVYVVGCERVEDCQWEHATGPWCWLLDRTMRIVFREPIPCRGRPVLWEIDDDAPGLVEAINSSLTPLQAVLNARERNMRLSTREHGSLD